MSGVGGLAPSLLAFSFRVEISLEESVPTFQFVRSLFFIILILLSLRVFFNTQPHRPTPRVASMLAFFRFFRCLCSLLVN